MLPIFWALSSAKAESHRGTRRNAMRSDNDGNRSGFPLVARMAAVNADHADDCSPCARFRACSYPFYANHEMLTIRKFAGFHLSDEVQRVSTAKRSSEIDTMQNLNFARRL